MYNAGKIIIGILIFLGLFTYPLWSPAVFGKAGPPPVLEKVDKQKGPDCVEDIAYMRTSHMTMLVDWRENVVREGKRWYTNSKGKKYLMSLQITCIECHKSKEKFCDRCHNYVNSAPKCWDCHIQPEYKAEQKVAERSQ